jgi:nucleoside-diphosphate-sugar epimerase
VDDQVEGIFRLLHSDYVFPVNIGNPDEITIKDFAEEIIKLTELVKSSISSVACKRSFATPSQILQKLKITRLKPK